MTAREEIAHLHSVIGDAHARLAVLYQEAARPPAPEAARPPAVEPDEPADVASEMTGQEYYDMLRDDKPELHRAQSLGKKLCNVDWKVSGWSPSVVATVRQAMGRKMPGDSRRKAVR
jgi:hypothetical protein